jgi:signal transduction histidine kinase
LSGSPGHLRGLRSRIIAWSFVPTALVLFAVALVSFFAYTSVTEQLVVERNRELGRLSAGQLASGLTEFIELLETIARTPDVARGAPIGQQAALTWAREKQSVFDGGVVILDAWGTVVAAVPERPDVLGQDWSSRTYFGNMLRNPGPVVSGMVNDGADGAPVVVLAAPIVGEGGQLRGAMLGMFNIRPTAVSSFYGEIVKLRVGEGNAYLLDADGNVLYHTDLKDVGTNLSSESLVQRVLDEKVGSFRTVDLQGNEVVAGFASVPGTDWSLVSLERWSTLMAPSRTYRIFLYTLLIAGLVLPAVVVWLGVRRLTSPLTDLKVAAQEVAGGRFGRTIDVRSGDEVQELADQFNLMSLQLQDSYAELEKRVDDRTRELATLNAIAAAAAGSVDLDRILSDALDEMCESLQMDVGVAFVVGEDGSGLRLVAEWGLSPRLSEAVRGMRIIDWGRWFGGRLLEPAAQSVSEHESGPVRDALLAEGVQLALTVPLVAKGRMLGAIGLGAREERMVGQDELDLLHTIGNYVGVATENARMYARAEEAAATAERSRLARDLHDAVSQTLFSASLIAEVLPRIYEKDHDEGERRLRELRDLTRGALAEMRALLLELRPAALKDAEVGDLLRQLTDAVTGRARVEVRLSIQGDPDPPLERKVALYRIAQEALNNVIKYAEASTVYVDLHDDGHDLRLAISDNGRGFDPAYIPADSFGLGIMNERAEATGGGLAVESAPGNGTTISVVWTHDGGKESEA